MKILIIRTIYRDEIVSEKYCNMLNFKNIEIRNKNYISLDFGDFTDKGRLYKTNSENIENDFMKSLREFITYDEEGVFYVSLEVDHWW